MDREFIIILVAVIIIVDTLFIFWFINRKRGTKSGPAEYWQDLANTFTIQLTGGEPRFPNISWLSFIKNPYRLEGRYKDKQLAMYHYTVSSGKNSTTYCTARIRIEHPSDLKLAISKEDFLSKIGKTLGMQDIQTGDERFDSLFVVKSSAPEYIQAALLPEIKERFYPVWETHKASGVLQLEDCELFYNEVGTFSRDATRARFKEVVPLLIAVSDIVEVYEENQ